MPFRSFNVRRFRAFSGHGDEASSCSKAGNEYLRQKPSRVLEDPEKLLDNSTQGGVPSSGHFPALVSKLVKSFADKNEATGVDEGASCS